MNTVLLKALVEQQQKAQQKQRYADEFNAIEQNYRNAMEKAYGLKSADEYKQEGSLGRAGDIITSNILGMFPGSVSEGRAEMQEMSPILVKLLRDQGFKDAFQGAAEAKMQIPSTPLGMLNFFKNVRESGQIPYAPNDPRLIRKNMGQTPNESAFNKMLKEVYGEK